MSTVVLYNPDGETIYISMARDINLKVGLMFAACLLIAGCATRTMKPSPGHVEAAAPAPAGEIPEPVRITPILPKPKPAARPETYSVVVNNVKVQELLFALARDAKLNVDIHSGITGSVTLNAINQTLPQLLDRISKQVDMRYEIDGPNLSVMPDTPYLRIYKIDYVNMDRDTTSTIGSSSQIATPGAAGAGRRRRRRQPVHQHDYQQGNQPFLGDAGNEHKGHTARDRQDNPRTGQAVAQPAAAAPAAQPGAAPAAGAAAPVAAAPAQPAPTFREAASVIANPESGVLAIRATSRQHAEDSGIPRPGAIQRQTPGVDRSHHRRSAVEQPVSAGHRLVLVRAPMRTIQARRASTSIRPSAAPRRRRPTGSMFALGAPRTNLFNNNLLASVRLLESFGTVRVLSSPRLTVLNNQTAILKVVDNQVYFTIQATTTPATVAGGIPYTTYTTTPNIVAVGLIMNVTPEIGERRQRAAQRAPQHIAHRRQRRRPQPDTGRALRRGRSRAWRAAVRSPAISR